jgi:ABC-type spermidine/putrescine transport system permease subunit I
MSLSLLIATRYLGYEQAGFASALGIYLLAIILIVVAATQGILGRYRYET